MAGAGRPATSGDYTLEGRDEHRHEGNSPQRSVVSYVLQGWFPYPRATNTHNSANERSSSNRFRNAKIFVAAVL